ncbi:hypothetical protein PMAYCL1PPCAC_16276, partial [Pristionchus mayeri]
MHSETLDDAVFYSSSTYLRVMIAIRITLACIALILLSILHINRKRFIAHRNLTLLLDIHSFWVFITCTSIVADHAYMIYLGQFRYQISENVRMIRIILPVVTSHVALSTFAIVIFFSVIYFMKLPNVYFPLFEDSINLMFLQGIFMPFFFLRQ